MKAELDAMDTIARTLSSLPDDQARRRVLDWTLRYFEVQPPPPAPAARPASNKDFEFGTFEQLGVDAEENARRHAPIVDDPD